MPPRIEVISAQEEKEWQFRAQTCEKPAVTLGDYQKAIRSLKKDKETKIWVPGKDEKEQESTQAKKPEVSLDDILKTLLETSKIQLSPLLVEDEVNRMLSRLIDQTQKLGLTVEQYLLAQGKTSDTLRSDYANQAGSSLALEFILEAIADRENIEVGDEEIEKLIEKSSDPKEKEELRHQKYYLASIIRRKKTLDRLTNL